eukprot:gene2229-2403_t
MKKQFSLLTSRKKPPESPKKTQEKRKTKHKTKIQPHKRRSSLDEHERPKNEPEHSMIRLFSEPQGGISKRGSWNEERSGSLSKIYPQLSKNKFSTPPLELSSSRSSTKDFSLSDENQSVLERIIPKVLPAKKDLYQKFTFKFCMTDNVCSDYFEACSVQMFKNVQDETLKKKLGLKIIEEYLIIGSSLELNISKEKKHECATNYEIILNEKNNLSIPDNFFDQILNSVITMLKIDGYPKFISSKEFKEYFSKYGYAKMKQEVMSPIDSSLSSNDAMTECMRYIYTGKNDVKNFEKMKGNMKDQIYETMNSKFPLDFCLGDEHCKKYFEPFVGNLFKLNEKIEKFKKTEKMKDKISIQNEIIQKYLMNNNYLSKDVINETVKTIANFGDSNTSNDVFDKLENSILIILKEKHSKFIISEEFISFYDQYGYLYEDEIETILSLRSASNSQSDSIQLSIESLSLYKPKRSKSDGLFSSQSMDSSIVDETNEKLSFDEDFNIFKTEFEKDFSDDENIEKK